MAGLVDRLVNLRVPKLLGIPIHKVLFLIAFVSVAVYTYIHYGHLMTFTFLKKQKHLIDDYVNADPIKAGTLYVSMMTGLIGFTLPGATFLSLCAGLFFPQPYATVYAYVGYVAGACISYGLVRVVFADVAKEYLCKKSDAFSKFQKGLADSKNFWHTVSFLMFIRYVAFFPFWFINASCAVLSIGYGYFILTTAMATLPGAAIYTIAGRLVADVLDEITDENKSEVIRRTLLKAVTEDRAAQLALVLLLFCATFPVVVRYYNKDAAAVFESGKKSSMKKTDKKDSDDSPPVSPRRKSPKSPPGTRTTAAGKKKAARNQTPKKKAGSSSPRSPSKSPRGGKKK